MCFLLYIYSIYIFILIQKHTSLQLIHTSINTLKANNNNNNNNTPAPPEDHTVATND